MYSVHACRIAEFDVCGKLCLPHVLFAQPRFRHQSGTLPAFFLAVLRASVLCVLLAVRLDYLHVSTLRNT